MTTHTLTAAERETVAALLTSFEYWDTIGERWTDRHIPNLRHAHRGHWFDADTLRVFGSRNLHLHRAGMLVETMTTAPDGTVWGLTVWTLEAGRPVPARVAYFSSLRAARRFAERAHALWPVFTACHALRVAGCPGTVDELIELTALTGVAA